MPPSESPAKDKTKRTPSSKAAVDDPTFTSGDFQVVTADNVRFLVASEVLLAASSVWKDAWGMSAMGSDEQAKSMSLTDGDFETAQVFRAFLILAMQGDLPDTTMTSWVVVKLVRFLKKWDCAAQLRMALVYLREYAQRGKTAPSKVDHTFIFAAGAEAEDLELCTTAITQGLMYNWVADDPRKAKKGWDAPLPKSSIWNPLAWSRDHRKNIPEYYSWALGRAFLTAGIGPNLVSEFCNYFKEEKAAVAVPTAATTATAAST